MRVNTGTAHIDPQSAGGYGSAGQAAPAEHSRPATPRRATGQLGNLPPRSPSSPKITVGSPPSLVPRSTSPLARRTPLDIKKVSDNGCASSSLSRTHSDRYESSTTSARHSSASAADSLGDNGHLDFSDYQVASADLNRANICAGLSTEWLRLKGAGTASSRLDTLAQGSTAYDTAAMRHGRYHDAIAHAHRSGAEEPITEGAKAILKDAGLRKIGESTTIYCTAYRGLGAVAEHLAKNNTRYLVSLRFMSGQGHAIAAATSGNRTKVFDPNYGEYEAAPSQVHGLLRALAAHYSGQDLDLAGVSLHRVQ
ncbi:YopT-type cysteine protease domain-containing protein [Ralstonia chuxiongensis]|uniref:YopT-type cysteine protease domain-containing protein n=1 Tax=Ralstonia chuxiongensis TaxID=2957504 RepID=UPI0028F59B34|nr:YopT-type cysteine protease domain-containing protein [Ralstonia chuxiongensis]CAJ0770951.1 Cysteine protease avirulence protein AvrPphB [Ralstonia chuxiongensis]